LDHGECLLARGSRDPRARPPKELLHAWRVALNDSLEQRLGMSEHQRRHDRLG
jgi:hypothetical protein